IAGAATAAACWASAPVGAPATSVAKLIAVPASNACLIVIDSSLRVRPLPTCAGPLFIRPVQLRPPPYPPLHAGAGREGDVPVPFAVIIVRRHFVALGIRSKNATNDDPIAAPLGAGNITNKNRLEEACLGEACAAD